MTKNSVTKSELVSRIERAPNVSRLVAAYDAALGGSDLSVHRHQGQWQVWHGEGSGLCGSFGHVRAHLAAKAEEILDHAADIDRVEFDEEEQPRDHLVCASAAEAHITLCGMEAERRGGDRRTGEIAAAASLHSAIRGGLSDAELQSIIDELIDPDPEGELWFVEASTAARLADARKMCC